MVSLVVCCNGTRQRTANGSITNCSPTFEAGLSEHGAELHLRGSRCVHVHVLNDCTSVLCRAVWNH